MDNIVLIDHIELSHYTSSIILQKMIYIGSNTL